MIVYFFFTSSQLNKKLNCDLNGPRGRNVLARGSFSADKVDKMRGNRKRYDCHISDFRGHLMGDHYA